MRVLGLCGAQGALLYPFRRYLVANVEPRAVFHTPNEEQWKLNFRDIPFIKSYLLENIEGPIDVILGSPSCGHSSIFSYSRKKTLGDPKIDLTLNLFLTGILKFQPKIFLMENLPKLLDLIPLEAFQNVLEGYELIAHCHSVMDFGNSQKSRERLILIGVKKGQNIKSSAFKTIYKVRTPMTCEELYEHSKIDWDKNHREDPSKILAMYDYRDPKHTQITRKRAEYLWTHDFKKNSKWPVNQPKMRNLPGVYKNKPDRYPLTVRPSSRQFNHRGKLMGLEEYRVIMGFPKSYQVYFDPENKTYWLNKGRNALTKGSVYEVARWFRECLSHAYARMDL